jgi:V/A-type H+-transporting ATPase subunit D
MELLAVRSRLGLARQGRELLEQKRDALMHEFYREVRTVYAAHVELETAAGAARHALEEARVLLGTDTISAAAADVVGQVNVDVELVTVMGVHVPAVSSRDLVRTPADRGRAPTVSGPALEMAAEAYEHEVTVAIKVASLEARARRLAREIRRTSSRVNALRTRVIPHLESEAKAILLALEQHERDDRFRLKRVKSRRDSTTASAREAGRAEAAMLLE